jgi:hypothetical protein
MGTRPVPESPAAAPSGGEGEPPRPGRFGRAEPSGPERELASSAQEREPDRDEKTADADAGTAGSLFTPRARPAEAGHERAEEAEPAVTPDASPADAATAPAAGDKTRTADDAGPAPDTDQASDTREAEDLPTGAQAGAPDDGRAKGAAEDGGDTERDHAGHGAADVRAAPDSGPGDRADSADDAPDAADGHAASDTSHAEDLGTGQADPAADTAAASGHDEVAAPGAEATGDGAAASEAETAPDRKPPPVDDHGGKPAEKPDTPGPDEAGSSEATPMDGQVTIVPGVSRYHRRGCILIRFLSDGDLETMTREAAEAAGSMPCKACQPDKPSSDF